MKQAMIHRLVLAGGSVLFTLALAEITLHLVSDHAPVIRFAETQEDLREKHLDAFAGVIGADPELFWDLIPDRRLPDDAWPIRGLVSNHERLREDHEIPHKPAPGEIRILFIGDSCTFGFGLLHPEGIVEQIERGLRKRYPGVPVECINAGVPGYTLYQGWRRLELRGLRYRPDLVVVNFGWNDSRGWDGYSDLDHYRYLQDSRPPRGLGWSRIARRIWSTLADRNRPEKPEGKRPRVSPQEYSLILKRVKGLTDAEGIPLLMLLWPMKSNIGSDGQPQFLTDYQLRSYAFGRKLRFGPNQDDGVVDLVARFQGLEEDPAQLYIDHGHTTAPANRYIAKAFIDKVAPWFEATSAAKRAARHAR